MKQNTLWYSCKSVDCHHAWKDSLIIYKGALCSTKTSYYSSLIEEKITFSVQHCSQTQPASWPWMCQDPD